MHWVAYQKKEEFKTTIFKIIKIAKICQYPNVFILCVKSYATKIETKKFITLIFLLQDLI